MLVVSSNMLSTTSLASNVDHRTMLAELLWGICTTSGVAGDFSVASDSSMCPGAYSASKNEYRNTPGGKGGRCIRLTTYHLHVPIVKKSGGLNLLEPCGPVQACNGTALPLLVQQHQSSVVGVTTLCSMDSLGVKSWLGLKFLYCPDQPWGPRHFCITGTGLFLRVKWPEGGADHLSHANARFWMCWSCTATTSLCLHRHVVQWPLPLPVKQQPRYSHVTIWVSCPLSLHPWLL